MTSRREFFVLSGTTLAAMSLPARAENAADNARGDKITQIRNATLRIEYGGVRFLVDPMLSERHSWPGFEGTVNSQERNSLVHLPFPIEDIVDVDAVIVTHLHEDHWDKSAQRIVPKSMPIFSQNDEDATIIRSQGFEDVRVLSKTSSFQNVQLIRTNGRHGTDEAYAVAGHVLGSVCGVVFKKDRHNTVYLAGDTIWNTDVAEALDEYQPQYAILNAGDAKFAGLDDGIIMGTADVLEVHRASPGTMLVASHMEAVNHCVLTRAELRKFARDEGFADMLIVPADGQAIDI